MADYNKLAERVCENWRKSGSPNGRYDFYSFIKEVAGWYSDVSVSELAKACRARRGREKPAQQLEFKFK